MKLSEAIMLGSTLGEQPTNLAADPWDHCLLGIACHAVGVTNSSNKEALRLWPWLNTDVRHPKIEEGKPTLGSLMLTYLCTRISRGWITWDEAVEMVRSVEPLDLPQEQTDVGQDTGIAKLEAMDCRK